MNKKHEANCPLCKHPEIAVIEKFFGDWYCPFELLEMFQLVGPGETYENESAAYRGIKRHMTAKRTPLDRRAKNCLGMLRCFARVGERALAEVDANTLLSISQKAAAKLAEIECGTKHHVIGDFVVENLANIPTKALEEKAIELLEEVRGTPDAGEPDDDRSTWKPEQPEHYKSEEIIEDGIVRRGGVGVSMAEGE